MMKVRALLQICGVLSGRVGGKGNIKRQKSSKHFSDEFYPGDTGGSLYDGRKQVLYWADVSTEVACVVPSPDTYQPPGRRSSMDSSAGKLLSLHSQNVFNGM